jgi:hypothetical protein
MTPLILGLIQILGPLLLSAGRGLIELHEKHTAEKHVQAKTPETPNPLEFAISQDKIDLDAELDNIFKKE